MKKLSVFALLVAASSVASANYPSIAMRGEITQAVVNAQAANLLTDRIANLPVPSVTVADVKTIDTVLIPANQSGSNMIDVTLIDEFLADVAPNARHYPPNFPSRTAEYLMGENIKHISDWLEPYASAADASFDVVLRAAKVNGMARNLNVGTDYSLRANTYMEKALKLQPNHDEANFLFGMMISEAGGFKEGQKYLEKAASLGYVEAEQSMAQADLLSDNKTAALKRLRDLAKRYPENKQIAEQISMVEAGGYYIWNIKDDNVSIKAIK